MVADRMYQGDVPVPELRVRPPTMAVILFMAVIPIMVINVRNLRRQGIGS